MEKNLIPSTVWIKAYNIIQLLTRKRQIDVKSKIGKHCNSPIGNFRDWTVQTFLLELFRSAISRGKFDDSQLSIRDTPKEVEVQMKHP